MMRRLAVPSLCFVTALVTGYYSLRLIFGTVNGERSSWPFAMLAASILLLVAGIRFAAHMRDVWLVLIAAAIPMLLCIALVGHLLVRCSLFALLTALSFWLLEAIASLFKRKGLLLLLASLALAISWVPFSVSIWQVYFAPTTSGPDPMNLL